jgi:hypothetical protein
LIALLLVELRHAGLQRTVEELFVFIVREKVAVLGTDV